MLGSYGSGAIMAVPAHDARDAEFARAFGLPIRQVVANPAAASSSSSGDAAAAAAAAGPGEEAEVFTAAGIAVNSASSSGLDLNGLPTSEAKAATIAWLEATGAGERKVNFKLRDWLFARQRYWGEPFPIVYPEGSEVRADGWVGLVDADPRNAVPCRVLAPSSAQSAPCPCAVLRPGCPPCPLRPCLPPIPVCHRPQQEPQAIPESQLPLRLPDVDDFKPSGTPDPPLAKVTQWVNTTDAAGRPAKRETSTMPQVVS